MKNICVVTMYPKKRFNPNICLSNTEKLNDVINNEMYKITNVDKGFIHSVR